MLRKYIIPLLALGGVVFAVYTLVWGEKPTPPVPPIVEVPQSPFPEYVAGSGLVEANTENISIGTNIAGIVDKIYVKIGSEVKAGDPLFAIDGRATRAEIDTRRATVQIAEVQLAEAQYNLAVEEKLEVENAATVHELKMKRFAMQKAKAELLLAQAEQKSVETEMGRLTVRAPIDGRVLQLKVRLGEYAPVNITTTGRPPLILLGGVKPLHVRVNVDEYNAWRVPRGAPAVGYLRSNKKIRTPLKFVRFEPYVVPKKSLTGDSTERVDTRVLQVIYSFDRGDLPIFVGQQMDVFIDASESPRDGPTTPDSGGS